MLIETTLAASTCTTQKGNAAVGGIILLAIIGAIALFAVLNAQARKQLAVANAELAVLRPEYSRLRDAWIAGTSNQSSAPISAGWQPDPTNRHEYRIWNGYTWGDEVADAGDVSSDPITGPE